MTRDIGTSAQVRRGWHRLWPALTFVATFPVIAEAQPAHNAAPARQTDHVAAAQHIYKVLCSSCHEEHVGPNLRGLGLPERLVVQTVRNGQSAMPAFAETEISDADLNVLARLIARSRPKSRSGK
jgi:mono/diheme cytochrome c family protein